MKKVIFLPLLVLFAVFGLVAVNVTAFADTPKTAAELGIMQGSPPQLLIDMSKWDKGPDNRWAFQHISEIIPTANISRGADAPTLLSRAPHDISGLVFEKSDGKKTSVKEMLDATYTDGFIVLQDGKVVFEKYYNGMTPDTLRQWSAPRHDRSGDSHRASSQ